MKFCGLIRKWKWIFLAKKKDIFNGKLVFGYLPFGVILNLQDTKNVYVLAYNCSFTSVSLPFFYLLIHFFTFVIQWLWRKNSVCNVLIYYLSFPFVLVLSAYVLVLLFIGITFFIIGNCLNFISFVYVVQIGRNYFSPLYVVVYTVDLRSGTWKK